MLAAAEAVEMGRGGVSLVSRACGLSRVTITKGVRELDEPGLPEGRTRRPGGGRKTLVAPGSRSCRRPGIAGGAAGARRSRVAAAVDVQEHADAGGANLTRRQHPISHEKVAQLLRQMDYQPAGQPEDRRGGRSSGPGRAVPAYQSRACSRALAEGCPSSPSTRRRRNWSGTTSTEGGSGAKPATAQQSQDHDFPDAVGAPGLSLRHLRPGAEHGLRECRHRPRHGAFAVASIRGWWRHEGRRLYPEAAAAC